MIQDFGRIHCLVHTSTLAPNDIDLVAWTCSFQWWQVTDIPCSYALMVFKVRELRREEYYDNYFLSDNFTLTYGEFSFQLPIWIYK